MNNQSSNLNNNELKKEIENLKENIKINWFISFSLAAIPISLTIFLAALGVVVWFNYSSFSELKEDINNCKNKIENLNIDAKNFENKIDFLNTEIKRINDKVNKSNTDLVLFEEDLKSKREKIVDDIRSIQDSYKKLAGIYIDVCNSEPLNLREKHLLVKLASRIDSDNPYYHLNAAMSAYYFGDNEEAGKHLDKACKIFEDESQFIPEEAKNLRSLIKTKRRRKFERIEPTDKDLPTPDLNTGELFKIQVNILNYMHHNGFISEKDYGEILGNLKRAADLLYKPVPEYPLFMQDIIKGQK